VHRRERETFAWTFVFRQISKRALRASLADGYTESGALFPAADECRANLPREGMAPPPTVSVAERRAPAAAAWQPAQVRSCQALDVAYLQRVHFAFGRVSNNVAARARLMARLDAEGVRSVHTPRFKFVDSLHADSVYALAYYAGKNRQNTVQASILATAPILS
jgi:hypothetical protein